MNSSNHKTTSPNYKNKSPVNKTVPPLNIPIRLLNQLGANLPNSLIAQLHSNHLSGNPLRRLKCNWSRDLLVLMHTFKVIH